MFFQMSQYVVEKSNITFTPKVTQLQPTDVRHNRSLGSRPRVVMSLPVSAVPHPEHLRQNPVQRPAVAAVCHSAGERARRGSPCGALIVTGPQTVSCVSLQNVLRKVQHQDALQISDVVMASLLRMFQSTAGSGGVQEDALMAVSTLVEGRRGRTRRAESCVRGRG